MTITSPFDALQSIRQRSFEQQDQLPDLQTAQKEWRGLSFTVGGTELVAGLSNVAEILKPTATTKIPGTKSWFEGIANVRGSLVPVMNFHGYLYGQHSTQTAASRIVVFKLSNSQVGLGVDSVTGLQQFYETDLVRELPELSVEILPYVDQAFEVSAKRWPLFDFNLLTANPKFLDITDHRAL